MTSKWSFIARKSRDGATNAHTGGREHVFAGLPWALYLPRDSSYRLEGEGEVAICGARCERRRDPQLVAPGDVEIEVRGAGNATRQINHLLKPDFPAERLLVVEVYTPAGNWSSYPPHKHDEDRPPENDDGQAIWHLPSGASDDDAVHMELHSNGSRKAVVKLGSGVEITLQDDEPVVKLDVGGNASLTIKKDGTVEIKGKDVTLNASGSMKLEASGQLTLKGATVNIN